LEVKSIHISERDSQITNRPKKVNEFMNTWSIHGFYQALKLFSEVGWGTHERHKPKGAILHPEGPQNMMVMPTKGAKTWARSWVPSGDIKGMVLSHDESFSISNYLTIKKDGKLIYRPTVHFVYMPSDSALASVHEMEMKNYRMQDNMFILSDKEIVDGMDEVGVLIMGHKYKSWWVGSRLDIHTAKKLAPGKNATTLQVAISALSGLRWIILNRSEGLCYSEQLPHNEIIEVARPFMSPIISVQTDWDPLKDRELHSLWDYGDMMGEHYPKEEDKWQFPMFLTWNQPLEKC